jgi:hypothetical protein
MITRHPLPPHRPGDRQALDPNVIVVAVRGSVPCKLYRCPLSRCMRLTGCLGLSVTYDCYGHGPKPYPRLMTPAAHNRISRLPYRCLRFRCPWTVACTPLPRTPTLNLCPHMLACFVIGLWDRMHAAPREHICMMDRRKTSK